MMTYRKLFLAEITQLQANGCSAAFWDDIEVTPSFDTTAYRNVIFSGKIKLGSTTGVHTDHQDGSVSPCGIYNAMLHNVTVGDGVLIRNVGQRISNYDILDGSYIENVGCIITTGTSSFGIGTEVSVMVETGGREVMLFEGLSAQLAYIMAMHRHNPQLTKAICIMACKEKEKATASRGRIGHHATIINAGDIINANIGNNAIVRGASLLQNGTISDSESHGAIVTRDVIARDFIIADCAEVSDGASLHNVYVGQGVHIGNRFSAHDSLFFANCTVENGEACSVFAGPCTVTMHKSTLLIGGMFSFFNAGSATNQSNHMYKLGPMHQGILERGSKTASGAYLAWPARIGAFSLVMGHHYGHPDTTQFPFSYIVEENGGTRIIPAISLRSSGTARDIHKWPQRDRRNGSRVHDLVVYDALSPYTVQRILQAIDILKGIAQSSSDTDNDYKGNGFFIKASSVGQGILLYNLALDIFFGKALIDRLNDDTAHDLTTIRQRLHPTATDGTGQWIDLAGLLTPKSAIDTLESTIVSHQGLSIHDISASLTALFESYTDMKWTWVVSQFRRRYGKEMSQLTPDDLQSIVSRYLEATKCIDRMIVDDAQKEYADTSMTGFGIDGDSTTRLQDFTAVHPPLDTTPFHLTLYSVHQEKALGLLSALQQLATGS